MLSHYYLMEMLLLVLIALSTNVIDASSPSGSAVGNNGELNLINFGKSRIFNHKIFMACEENV